MSSASLVRAYNQEVDRQRNLIRKADLVQQRLAFVAAAMGNLLSDEHFINLLRAEPKANVERYDGLRAQTAGGRHAS
jgi:ParB family chromosome partitioning protein